MGFDFVHMQTADIGVTWPWAIAFLLENYSNYFDDFTCWLSDEWPLPLFKKCKSLGENENILIDI